MHHITTLRRPAHLWVLVTLAVIAALTSACSEASQAFNNQLEKGHEETAQVQVGLQNRTGEPAAMWLGHDEAPPPGTSVPPGESHFRFVGLKVYLTPIETGTKVTLTDCGAAASCVLQDNLRVNVEASTGVRSEVISLHGRAYSGRAYIIWDGQSLRSVSDPNE